MSHAIDLDERPPPKTPEERFERALGDRVLEAGLVTADELKEAARHRKARGVRLSTALHALGLMDEVRLRKVCGEVLKTPALPGRDVVAGARELGDVLPVEDAVSLRVIPFAKVQGTLLIATAEPWRLALLDDLASRTRLEVKARFLDEGPLALALEELHEVPADPQFHEEPARRERAAPAAVARTTRERAAQREETSELMSESTFDELYRR